MILSMTKVDPRGPVEVAAFRQSDAIIRVAHKNVS